MRGLDSNSRTNQGMVERLRRLAIGGALAALLAAGALGMGVAGDPSQWGVTAGDPSQWGQVAGDPSQWGAAADDHTALNFTKIEMSLNFAKIQV